MIKIDIQLRIEKLRELMKQKGIDAYIIPNSDPHQSEYVAEHYASRTFISGFTGSAGIVVVTLTEAGLWTDGRYFVQAENQLKNTPIQLFRIGESGVPSIEEYLKDLPNGSTIGLDGRVISINYFKNLNNTLSNKSIQFETTKDLIDEVWQNRPEIPATPVISHDNNYTGQTREEKIEQVMAQVNQIGASHYIIASLDDIAWLLNIRGKDIEYNPLTIAYTVLSQNGYYLFIDEKKLSHELKVELKQSNIIIKPYESIQDYCIGLEEGSVLLDPSKVSIWLSQLIQVKIIESMDLTTKLKAIKNEHEIENIRNVMIRDGVVMVKFIKWIKETIKNKEIPEIEASDYLEALRKADPLFYDYSFSTISAYRAHAAMPHYRASKETQAIIKAESLYLVDSGAQYLDGTTDITRTLAMGPLTNEEKTDYTLVLKGMINLSNLRFLYGSTGTNLDIVARIPLWNAGLDYKHGTGHGVGFFLNVHEGPHRIGFQSNNVTLEKGMLMSNEPGVYKSGKHGIRIENLIVVDYDIKTQYGGQFMKFETLTLCPIDTNAIDVSLLTQEELNWLNQYHQLVFDKLSPHLNEEETEFLKEATKPL